MNYFRLIFRHKNTFDADETPSKFLFNENKIILHRKRKLSWQNPKIVNITVNVRKSEGKEPKTRQNFHKSFSFVPIKR